ncbi:bifunctional glycosyltransferase/CDP-glycerol:glycerophosphate glycerophosphotransferase [Actinomadura sp. WAC 06369]|uniref:bifunctional glycosyltransferase/CDP-glycerol:glycerophosphate glycerophosphotransferase n=1 Tax=Actinomadura sp. WAC 06369 TaxID=2203193 RepID=UPI000F7694C9|nr:bifunctional glycosyltransferase family 2 protein/CDP-glycerol:glycerophosphate glycerophosphotransferase [Actinomadura sp. WAC 06369]RSN60167.1 CDP-glycerol--glycerophosphate glycerophosphotransferase [Actinomadura sp. WAC 06369]
MSPKLSVVVPFHNTEEYLRECLESLAGQSFRDLEVIMVDDGSTDNGAVIAKEMCERDGRFRLVAREQEGPGPARNAGVRQAKGKYLAFADADDVVAPDAYLRLVGALERSGSDLACGNVERTDGERTWRSVLHDGVFAERKLSTHVSARPLLIRDRTPWNKVYRREFWDGAALEFPEGFYEDPPVTVRAHALAKAVDVLPDTVYLWRKRQGSITEDRYDWDNISQRMRSARSLRDGLASCAPQLLNAYDEHALVDVELRVLFEALPKTDDDRRAELVEMGGALAERIAPKVLKRLPAMSRLQLHLLAHRMLPELEEVLRFVALGGPGSAPRVRRGLRHRWFAEYPFFEDEARGLPAHLYDVTDELAPVAAIDRATWVDGRLRLEGHAFIRHLDSSTVEGSRIRLWLLAANRRGLLKVPVRRVRRPDVTARSRESEVSYDWSGFVAEIEPSQLRIFGRWRDIDWIPCVEIVSRGVRRRRTFANPAQTRRLWPDDLECVPGVRVQGVAGKHRFVVQVRRTPAAITGCRAAGGELVLDGWSHEPFGEDARVTATARGTRETVAGVLDAGRDGRGFRVRLPIGELAGRPGDWDVALPGGARPHVTRQAAGAAFGVPGGELEIARTRRSALRIVVREPVPVVERVTWAPDGVVTLHGGCPDPAGRADALVLRRRRSCEEHRVPLRWEDGRFTASFAPARMPLLGLSRPLVPGRWDVLVEAGDGERAVVVRRHALRDLPDPHETGLHRVTVRAVRTDRLQFRVETALDEDERGEYAQRRLRSGHYRRHLNLPARELAVFDAYRGRQYSCNPRGIYDELRRRGTDVECVWVTANGQFGRPPGARVVLSGTREYYEALARARYIFGNWSQQPWFVKREDQTYVQCWHGTPLKKLGYDVKEMPFKRTEGVDWMEHDVPRWDLLLSQNEFSVPLFRRAFGYDGEVLESGYPRNDILSSPHRDDIAAAVRRRLGIPKGKRVVLYAPTWRDDFHLAVGKRAFRLEFDVDRFRRALGRDHVLLLRTHYLVTDRPKWTPGDCVIDVSVYPDISELYLISDVLVTDYSSSMFDFAVTGRPMAFFTYDLERYRDHVRGFYFDFEAEAPGPLLPTAQDVVDALGEPAALDAGYRAARAAFAARYCPHDDGRAASRVLDRVLSKPAH